MRENSTLDRKSLRTIVGRTADFNELAKDCVAFANSNGGHLLIGIEDDSIDPPCNQTINQDLVDKFVRRMNELTIHVFLRANILKHDNGGEYMDVQIFPSRESIASTTKGGYFIRDDDKSRAVLPDELSRLISDKPSYCWETKVSLHFHIDTCDKDKKNKLLANIRKSDRVFAFVREKSDIELLEYFSLLDEHLEMTNLGVLWIGTQPQRARLLYTPVVQYIKYDSDGEKINKIVWDDYSHNPEELLTAIWNDVPDWKESYEISEGLWRKNIPCYDEKVVREVLCNAIIHRPYTTRGDIFINMYPDRMEVVNPGHFPIGVTPDNILQKSVKRNEHLARLCIALHLMEGEGSGYDLMYETLLLAGKSKPLPIEKEDSVSVTIMRKIDSKETAKLCEYVLSSYSTNQKNRIALGIIVANKKITATALSRMLQVSEDDRVRTYVNKLLDQGIVVSSGRGKGTTYSISPKIVSSSRTNLPTTLKTIEPYRLSALIKEDLRFHPNSLWSDISSRLPDVEADELQKTIRIMARRKEILYTHGRKYRQYYLP